MIVFLSNYFNHHQRQLSDALFTLTKGNYRFIQTMQMEQERQTLGWGEKNIPNYVLISYKNPVVYDKCMELINNAEVVIAGSYPRHMLKERTRSGRIIFHYSERPLKNGIGFWGYVLRLCAWRILHTHLYSQNIYLLCASAYTAGDYHKFLMYRNRCYKWGYFPFTNQYTNIKNLIQHKKEMSLLWAGRLIDWKHPEYAIEVARRLKADNYKFKLNIIGTGDLENTLRQEIDRFNLDDCVKMLGAMSPENVRKHMEQSEIYLFTSDFKEGWGAVLNEAMNSGCACVASHAIGSVPFLLKHEVNGLIYKNGDMDDLYHNVKMLMNDSAKRVQLGEMAYKTISELWNAEIAAERFLKLCQGILSENPTNFKDGPCSRAEIIKDNWM